jgi:hypothetical protein
LLKFESSGFAKLEVPSLAGSEFYPLPWSKNFVGTPIHPFIDDITVLSVLWALL